jgi:hypothetical protein
MLDRHGSNPTSPLFFGEAWGKHPAGITARSWFLKRPPVKSSDAAPGTLWNGARRHQWHTVGAAVVGTRDRFEATPLSSAKFR